MSKIGRRPINIDGVNVGVKGNIVTYKGSKSSGTYELPRELSARMEGNHLYIDVAQDRNAMSIKQLNAVGCLWGLHRSLLANKVGGSSQEFEKNIEINGLGYKATLADKKIIFVLGYSHKIEMKIPTGITVEIDRSGQKIKVKSSDKEAEGQFCSEIRALRPPEPYKGKGIKLQTEVIIRKAAGKGKK